MSNILFTRRTTLADGSFPSYVFQQLTGQGFVTQCKLYHRVKQVLAFDDFGNVPLTQKFKTLLASTLP